MAYRDLDLNLLEDPGAQATPTAPVQNEQPQPAAPEGSAQNPTAAWLRQHARDAGWSEDFARFDDNTLNSWLKNYWDPNQQMFRTEKTDMQGNPISGFVEKPVDTPSGWQAWGPNNTARRTDDIPGVGGGGGGGGYGPIARGIPGGGNMPNLPAFHAPTFEAPTPFQAPKFVAPTGEAVFQDPGYQFRLKQGQGALESSAAARGVLRTGGTLKDILGYGQDFASQEYGNAYNRALQAYETEYQGAKDQYSSLYDISKDKYASAYQAAKDEYAPEYAKAMAGFGRDWDIYSLDKNEALQKYLQREGIIGNLIMPPAPSY